MLVTHTMLEAAYTFLLTCPPFRGWKLPLPDQVEFAVTRHRDREGDHSVYKHTNEHILRVSSYHVKTTDVLLLAVAHEMLHAYQDGVARTGSRRVDHNSEFKRLAARVCSAHGWDVNKFVGPA